MQFFPKACAGSAAGASLDKLQKSSPDEKPASPTYRAVHESPSNRSRGPISSTGLRAQSGSRQRDAGAAVLSAHRFPL